MVAMSSLFIPVVVSAVLVFVVSSVIHMATPWHKGDYASVPKEDEVMQVLRPFGLPPGDYMMPRPASMDEMRSPAFVERSTRGPRVVMTVLPGGPTSIGRNLIAWLVYLLLVGVLVAGLDALALRRGQDYHDVFHVTLLASFLGYAAALWQMTVWYNRSIGTTIRSTIDGFVYALVSAAVFSFFWPA